MLIAHVGLSYPILDCDTFRYSNMAMATGPFIGDSPTKSPTHRGFSTAMFDYQRLPNFGLAKYGEMVKPWWNPQESCDPCIERTYTQFLGIAAIAGAKEGHCYLVSPRFLPSSHKDIQVKLIVHTPYISILIVTINKYVYIYIYTYTYYIYIYMCIYIYRERDRHMYENTNYGEPILIVTI